MLSFKVILEGRSEQLINPADITATDMLQQVKKGCHQVIRNSPAPVPRYNFTSQFEEFNPRLTR